MILIVALEEGRQQLEVIRLIGVEQGAGHREHVDDFRSVVVVRGIVDGARRVEPDEHVESGGPAGKGNEGEALMPPAYTECSDLAFAKEF